MPPSHKTSAVEGGACSCERGETTPVNCWSCDKPKGSDGQRPIKRCGRCNTRLTYSDDSCPHCGLSLTTPVRDIVMDALRQLRDLEGLDRDEAYLLERLERGQRLALGGEDER